MKLEDWKKRELEKFYVNILILEEETYIRKNGEIKKQKVYILLGVNLKGIKEVLGVHVPEEETTGFWMREVALLKERGIEEIFTVSMIDNKWLRKVIKMNYPNAIYTPSLMELYNRTQRYISRRDHDIIMRDIRRIYRAKTKEEGKAIYQELKERYKDNKLYIMIVDKYIKEIFEMFKYGYRVRNVTSSTDSNNKMRRRVRNHLKEQGLFENEKELKEYLYAILKEEEEKWHVTLRKWDQIVSEMNCNLSEKIIELI